MATHTAKIEWTREADAKNFAKGHYSRGHLVIFDGGVSIPGSSSPSVVRPPLSVEAAADPASIVCEDEGMSAQTSASENGTYSLRHVLEFERPIGIEFMNPRHTWGELSFSWIGVATTPRTAP